MPVLAVNQPCWGGAKDTLPSSESRVLERALTVVVAASDAATVLLSSPPSPSTNLKWCGRRRCLHSKKLLPSQLARAFHDDTELRLVSSCVNCLDLGYVLIFLHCWTVMLERCCKSAFVQSAGHRLLRRFGGDSTTGSITPLRPSRQGAPHPVQSREPPPHLHRLPAS